MACVIVPDSLARLFDGLPRRIEVDGGTVGAVIAALNVRYPGLADRLCESGLVLRRHIQIFVGDERAFLTTAVPPGSEILIVPAVSGG